MLTIKPIFQQAFFSRVGADNGKDIALVTLQILFSQPKKISLCKKCE